MAYYRHFVEQDGFKVFVATDASEVHKFGPSYPVFDLKLPRWLERAGRTRMSLWVHSFKLLFAGRSASRSLLGAVQQFQPDLVLTVAGSWFWTSSLAGEVARRCRLPLAASFNDWFDYGVLLHPGLRRLHERQFRAFYRRSQLALCTSEGMREMLGEHPNAAILYPMGSRLADDIAEFQPYENPGRPFRLAFAGNMGDWYGPMLEKLITETWKRGSPVEFRLFGSNPTWSASFDAEVRRRGLYGGQIPFAELQRRMKEVDGLLLLMGFEKRCELVERTSFKTKFLDYLAFQKPIFLWGPDYCSSARIAREFDSAESCAAPGPEACLDSLVKLAASPERQRHLVRNARRMYEERFHPDRIHALLMEKCRALAEQGRLAQT
jgi:hypothetical protein